MRISGKWSRRLLLGTLVIAVGSGIWWGVNHLIPRGPVALARLAYNRGAWSEASDQAMRRLKVSPDDRDALRLLARSNARLGRDESAQRIFLRLGANTWEAEDYLLLGLALRRQGRIELAWASFLNARKADKNQPEALEQMAQISLDSGRPIEAAGLARILAALPGQQSRGDLALARASEELGETASAVELLGRELRRVLDARRPETSPGDLQKRLARDLLKLGKHEEARQQLIALGTSSADPEVAWLLSRAHLQGGLADEAARALVQAGNYASDDPLRLEPAPFVGAARCAECHATIHRAEQGSRHARTIVSGADFPRAALPESTIDDPIRPGVKHSVKRDGDRLRVETTVEGKTSRATIDYAVGSGHRGYTFIGRDDDGRLCELRLTRYGNGPVWDLTTGQDPKPSAVKELLGRTISEDEFRRCISCHTTRPVRSAGRTEPDPVDRSIGCERCHGPGGNHLQAVAMKFSDLAIARPGLAKNAQVINLCGSCHGPPTQTVQANDPGAVRFQASAIVKSRCYTESAGGISCLTCHDPHRDAETKPAFYEAKCLGCHDAGLPTSEADRRVICPVGPKTGCLDCHMPTVKGVVAHTTFTDHQIRVNKAEPRPSPRPGTIE
jgi:tetratricopeptide (TPR) repeat protein